MPVRKTSVIMSNFNGVRLAKLWGLIALFLLIFGIFAAFVNYKAAYFATDDHLIKLAGQFIENDLFLDPSNLPAGDYADYKGRQYVFHGPLPSILLVPPVYFFGENFPQLSLSIIALIVTYFAIYSLSRTFILSKVDSMMLANFFVFGTVLVTVGILNFTAYEIQAIGTVFMVLAILEYFKKRRWLVIGILVGAAGLTRMALFGASIFFILEIIRLRRSIDWQKALIYFCVPIIVFLSAFGVYNFRRFGSPFESGYNYFIGLQVYPHDFNSKFGIFSLKHLPANLYVLLFKAPDPILEDGGGFVLKFPYLGANNWGLSILFSSPLFLYLVNLKRSNFTFSAIVTIVALMIPSMFYFGIGYAQFGYRYSLDFLPFLFLLLIPIFKKGIPVFAKILIIYSIFFIALYMLSFAGVYPFFGYTTN